MNSSIGLVGLRRSIRDYAESPQQEPGSDQRFASKIRPTRHDPAPGIMEEYAELRAQRFVGACESGRLRPHAHLPASAGSRTPGGSGGRVLADPRARARRSRVLRRASFFLSRSWTNPPGCSPASFPLVVVTLAAVPFPADGWPPQLSHHKDTFGHCPNSTTREARPGSVCAAARPYPSPARTALFPLHSRVCLCRLSWVSDKDQTF